MSQLGNLENKLAARGKPSTKLPRDETRREGSACSPKSTVIHFKLGPLPELSELLNITTTPYTCDTMVPHEKVSKNVEKLHLTETSAHSKRVKGDDCKLFEAWLASKACLGSILVGKFDSQNTHLGDTPSHADLDLTKTFGKQIFWKLSWLQLAPQ